MSVYQNTDVLTGLIMLKDLAEKHPNRLEQDFGICYYLNQICSDGMLSYEYAFVNHFSNGWEYHSGINRYPINDNIKFRKWEGENLILRINLLNHLIGRVLNHSKSTYNTLKLTKM